LPFQAGLQITSHAVILSQTDEHLSTVASNAVLGSVNKLVRFLYLYLPFDFSVFEFIKFGVANLLYPWA